MSSALYYDNISHGEAVATLMTVINEAWRYRGSVEGNPYDVDVLRAQIRLLANEATEARKLRERLAAIDAGLWW